MIEHQTIGVDFGIAMEGRQELTDQINDFAVMRGRDDDVGAAFAMRQQKFTQQRLTRGDSLDRVRSSKELIQ